MDKLFSLFTPIGLAAIEYAVQEAMRVDLSHDEFATLLHLANLARCTGESTLGAEDYPAIAAQVFEALERVN